MTLTLWKAEKHRPTLCWTSTKIPNYRAYFLASVFDVFMKPCKVFQQLWLYGKSPWAGWYMTSALFRVVISSLYDSGFLQWSMIQLCFPGCSHRHLYDCFLDFWWCLFNSWIRKFFHLTASNKTSSLIYTLFFKYKSNVCSFLIWKNREKVFLKNLLSSHHFLHPLLISWL